MIKQQQDVLTPGSVIVEQDQWVDSVYEIAEQDYVHGGPQGFSNVPHEQLANRTFYLKTVHEQLVKVVDAFKLAVTNQDAANAQDFVVLRAATVQLQTDLSALQQACASGDAALQAEVDALILAIQKVAADLAAHVHLYAGSDAPGGDALTVKFNQTLDSMNVVGLASTTAQNILSVNPKVNIVNDTVIANNFKGDLVGNAASATRLTKPFTLTMTGDVAAVGKIDGGQDVNLQTTLASTGVAAGKYGPPADAALDNYDKFVVPSFEVSQTGVLLNAVDRVLMLPSLTRSRTAGAEDTTGKLFIVGAQQQTTVEQTYTELRAYICDGILFSNDSEVVNLNDHQDLVHKTYNGYTLNEACERLVDDVPGGILGSNALITSNAVKLHEHDYIYAAGDSKGGSAVSVVVDKTVADRGVVVNDGSTRLEVNNTVVIGDGSLTTRDVTAVNQLVIPGGAKLWFDPSVNGVSVNPGATVSQSTYDDTVLQRKMTDLSDAVDAIAAKYGDISKIVAVDQANVKSVVDGIAEVKANVTVVNAAYSKLSTTIGDDHAAVISTVDDVLRLKSAMTTLSNSIAEVANDLTKLTAELKVTNTRLTDVENDVAVLKINGRVATLAPGTTCLPGMVLSYAAGGYILADFSQLSTVDNVVLTVEKSSTYGHVTVIDGGRFALPDATHDGAECFVGTKGKLTFARPTSGFVKSIGFVEGNALIFRPGQPAVTA